MTRKHFQSVLHLADIATIGGFKMQGAANEDYAGFNFGYGDINGDGLTDLIVCADGYDGGGLLAGGAFVIYGDADRSNDFIDFANLVHSEAFVIQGEFAYDLASRSIAGIGDVNGDGIGDMLIGAFKNDEGAYDSGAAYIIYGKAEPFDGPLDLYDLPVETGIKLVGEGAEDYASFWVASAGDINADGREDMIIGAPLNDGAGTNSGAAYVIFGRDSNFAGKIELASLDPAAGFKITGAAPGDEAGYGVSSVRDFNGDGVADLLVSSPQEGTGAGLTYVIYGGSDIGALDLATLAPERGFAIRGEAPGDMAGFNVAGAGDVNGDGLDDIIIGATYQDAGGSNAGAAYVVFGRAGGYSGTFDLSGLDGTNGFKILGARAGDAAGVCVSSAGDVNGDGYADILVGSWTGSVDGTGYSDAYLLFGKATTYAPSISLATLDDRTGIKIRSEGIGDTTGRALSAAGDMNGDGYDDIAIGSPGNGAAGVQAGAAYVIYGRPDNQAPVGVDSLVSGLENTPYVFQLSDFGFTDDGDALLEVEIATLASRGTLMLDDLVGGATAVTAGLVVTAADIASGRLYFEPAANESGPGYATFEFVVRDDGGIVGNGSDTATAAATLTIGIVADPTNAVDIVYGTAGGDALTGSGSDVRLIGETGDDVYTVGQATDVVVEAVGEGTDTIRTSVSFELAADSEIEFLEATDPDATTFLRLWGNAFDNHIRGNNGVNAISGGGGSNVLEGLGGDDSYLVDSSMDRIVEVQGGGHDTAYALGDYALASDAEVEVLLSYDRTAAAAQNLTGSASDNLIQGNYGDNVLIGGGGRDTLYGFRGDDTYYVDSADDVVVELAGEGADTIITSVSYVMPQGMEFEYLRTIDPDSTLAIDLTGNKIPNVIIGNAGNNVIDGLGGGDDMRGLGGDDTYIVRRSNDRIEEGQGSGHDVVRTLVDYALSLTSEVEDLVAYDVAATTPLRLTGNDLANTIIGNAGANGLIGGGGDDILQGLGGNDIYVVDSARDRVLEAAGGGYDTLYTLGDFKLEAGSEIETLIVYDRATTTALRLEGNEFANTIYGNAGNNGLIGGGGNDVLMGLGGNDSYIVESAGDRVIESVGGGSDTVYALASFVLEAGSEIEVLSAYDRAATASLRLEGNEFGNAIYGNAGDNALIGGGGADILRGLGGADSYIVESAADRVIEAVGGGYDTVYALSDFTIEAGSEVEVLSAYDRESTAAVRLQGNSFDNQIYGNAGSNALIGGGGNDKLYGLGGNDSYLINDARAQVFEAAGGGYDTVYAAVSYALAAGTSIEVLTAYDRAGVTSLNLAGNEQANTIYGNNGQNRLDGGRGADTLYGLGGADTFVFSALPQATEFDRIADFVSGADHIELGGLAFAGIGAGELDVTRFVSGSVALDAGDRIMYDQASGALYYDADGAGGTEAVHFASLAAGTVLTAADLFIV
ncbi:FG-GAP-like repeat-containing protein [Sphingomonas psychrotolerans]|uniref:FG-GAP-like repeat-containing protein n=1 Tax=Sphingomonas psychrotolerans TaxID=1327635 RepID=A0ABU3N5E4_9SPHN|nr:FG-GAP-like repeat-containing protein [Sphingomonas psychrotolerans]MDT8759739.1 FG-GAP-like repeat-containing protein [Sphingomonas psychrotolerans]